MNLSKKHKKEADLLKRFWKKANRGLLLGGVLLLAMTVFIVVKEVQFRREVPELRETVRSYADAILQINVLPDTPTLGSELTEEQKNTYRTRLNDVLVKYWYADVAKRDISEYSRMATEVMEEYEELLSSPVPVIFSSVEYSLTDRNVSITQDGPDRVRVTVQFEGMNIKWQGNPSYFFFGGELYLQEIEVRPGESEKPTEPEEPAVYQSSFDGYLELELMRVGGEWRVVGTDGNFYNTGDKEIIITKEVAKP